MNIKRRSFFDRGKLLFRRIRFCLIVSQRHSLVLTLERDTERVGALHKEEFSMRKMLKLAAVMGAAACLFSVSACATTDSVKAAQAAADSANSAASAASAAAAKAQSSADAAAAAAGQAGTSAQAVSDKVDTFIREECAESKKEAQHHSACGVSTGEVKG
ncbi:MAG: hypothetical protein ABWZ40_06555 [Caulobacterales bacterium]